MPGVLLTAGWRPAALEWRAIRARSGRAWRTAPRDGEPGPLVFSKPEQPRVSIVIPAFNEWVHTFNCLRSLRETRSTVEFEVVVVDDGSTDGTPAGLRAIDGVTVLRNDSSRGFLQACNLGLEHCRGTDVLFLNNDTRVTDGWLDALVEVFDRHRDCGIVGPRLLFPNGLLQEAGGVVWRDGGAANVGKFDDPDKPEYAQLREVDYVSGSALLVRREVLGEGFDERYSPGYWEDVDLCFRARARGFRVLYQPGSEVFHFEGASEWRAVARRSSRRQRLGNEAAFRKAWASELSRQPNRRQAVAGEP